MLGGCRSRCPAGGRGWQTSSVCLPRAYVRVAPTRRPLLWPHVCGDRSLARERPPPPHRCLLELQDTWLRAIVSRPAKRRVVEAGDLAAAGEQHERHGGTDGPPHVGETLHMLGLECVAVPLMNPVRKSVPKFAS